MTKTKAQKTTHNESEFSGLEKMVKLNRRMIYGFAATVLLPFYLFILNFFIEIIPLRGGQTLTPLNNRILEGISKKLDHNTNQAKFVKLTENTLVLVEESYTPNLLLNDRYVPPKLRSVIEKNMDSLQILIEKHGAEPDEYPEYYILKGLICCGKSASKIELLEVAKENFNNYIDIVPYDEKNLVNLGVCYHIGDESYSQKTHKELEKEYNKAIELFKEALQYNPRYCRAHYNLALTLAKLNKKEQSLDVISHYLDHVYDCAEAFFTMSTIQCKFGNKDLAYTYLSKAIEKGFDDINWMKNTSFYDEEFKKSTSFKSALKKIENRRFLTLNY